MIFFHIIAIGMTCSQTGYSKLYANCRQIDRNEVESIVLIDIKLN